MYHRLETNKPKDYGVEKQEPDMANTVDKQSRVLREESKMMSWVLTAYDLVIN